MKPIRKWKPEGNPIGQFKNEINGVVQRFFEDPFFSSNPLWNRENDLSPALNVVEKSNRYTVEVEIPGIDAEEVEIAVEDRVLIIKGERKEEKEEKDNKVHVMERSYGTFQRALTLPENVDTEAIDAESKNGMLYIQVPKTAAAERRRINIKNKDNK